MPSVNRIKISAAYTYFVNELNRLQRFSAKNQRNYHAGGLTDPQIELLVESVFFTCFRAYENFIREIFLLYTLSKRPRSNRQVTSNLNPRNFLHAEQLIKSSMKVVDWNSPDTIIERAEIYLNGGFPIKLPISSNLNALRQFKKLRNHIAHDSIESLDEFKKVVNNYYGGIAPLSYPTSGQYLMLASHTTPANNLLIDFFDLMRNLSYDLT